MEVSSFIQLMVDPIRLAVVGAAAVGHVDPAALAASLGVDEKRILHELGRVTAAGLIADGRLDLEVLRSVATALPQVEAADSSVTEGPWTADETKVLQTFFAGNRLKEIPTNLSKRRVVLERLAMEFEPGRRYDEREVNFTLQLFHPDFAALRRYMVDSEIMTRADGVYWRTGGRYEVAETRPD